MYDPESCPPGAGRRRVGISSRAVRVGSVVEFAVAVVPSDPKGSIGLEEPAVVVARQVDICMGGKLVWDPYALIPSESFSCNHR